MSTVLVTGAAGFLGSHLCRRLASDGHVVVGMDLVHRTEAWRLRDVSLAEYLWIDLEDFQPGHLEGAERVIHCAGVADVPRCNASPRSAVAATIQGTVGLLEAARRADSIQQVAVVSSFAVYGRHERQPISEDASLLAASVYGAIKAGQEALALSYARTYGTPISVTRISTIYGEAGRATLPATIFLRRALHGEDITVSGDGSQARDMNYVANAVDGILACTFDPVAIGKPWNLGSGKVVTIRSLAEACIDAVGSRSRVVESPPRAGEEGVIALDCTRARAALGYAPKVGFSDGIRRTAAWFREHDRQ